MRRILSVGIAVILITLLCGCGSNSVAPELIAPKTNEVEYVRAELSDVGRTRKTTDKYSVVASVCPRDYCQFFKKSATLSDINVEIGDYVNEGERIATVNCEDAARSIEKLEQELAYKSNLKVLVDEQYVHDHDAAKAMQSLSSADYRAIIEADPYAFSPKEKEKMLGGLDELEAKRELDEQLDAFDRAYIQEQISLEKERLGETELRANHSGYVTYIKDLASGYECAAKENVVVISDYNDPVIELTGVDCSHEVFRKYSDYYCLINGEKYDIVKDPYSEAELQVMQSKKHYACERVSVVGYDGELKVGDCFEVVFRNHFIADTLAVYNESIQQDKNGYFVYVKTPEGDIRRDVIIGEKDEKKTQILEGLSEGEEVRREVNPLLKDSTKYKAGYKEVPLGEWKFSDKKEITYFSKYEGIVDEVFFDSDDEVDAGDLIFTIKVEGSRTNSFGLQKDIENAELSREEELTNMDENIANLEKSKYKDSIVPWGNIYEELKEGRNNGDNVDALENEEFHYLTSGDVYDAQIESCKVEKRIIDYKYAYLKQVLAREFVLASRDMSQDGRIEFRVKEAGKLGRFKIKTGNTVRSGSSVFVNKAQDTPRLIVFSADTLPLGTHITVRCGEEKYTGSVIGASSRNNPKYYTTSEDGKVYLSFDNQGKGKNAYYVEMEDDFYKVASESEDMTCMAEVFVVEGEGNV